MNAKVGRIIGRRRKYIGALGEALVQKHLINKGFSHIESNFLRKQGELDLIMENNGKLHFLEVKTVSRVRIKRENENKNKDEYRPEENVSQSKLRKLSRMVLTYLIEKKFEGREWQFDVAVVYLDQKNKKAYLKFLKDIPLTA